MPFGSSVGERAEETGSSESTLYPKAARFNWEGIENLFTSSGAKRRGLPPAIRRLTVARLGEGPLATRLLGSTSKTGTQYAPVERDRW